MKPTHPNSSTFSPLSPSSTGQPFYMVYAPSGVTAPKVEHALRSDAETEASRLVAQINKPVFVLMAVSKFERQDPPITKTDLKY